MNVHLSNSEGTIVESLPVTIFLNDVNDNSPVWRNQVASLPALPEVCFECSCLVNILGME